MAITIHMHSLMSGGYLMYLFMNDFLPGCLLAIVVMMVNGWRVIAHVQDCIIYIYSF